MCTSRKSYCTDEIYDWFCGAADEYIKKVVVPAMKPMRSAAERGMQARRQWSKYEAVSTMLNKRIAQYLNRYHTSSNNLPTIEKHWGDTFQTWMRKENISQKVLLQPTPIVLSRPATL